MRRRLMVLPLLLLPTVAFAQQAETIEYYQADLVGSIRIVYDVNGNVIGRQDYTPFGTPVLNGASLPNEGYDGNVADAETQQMYFHARSLSSRLGRFSQPDPIFAHLDTPQALNRYSYAVDNPVDFQDHFGLVVSSDCTYVEVQTNDGLSGTLKCTSDDSGGTPQAVLDFLSLLGSKVTDVVTGTTIVGGDELVPTPKRGYIPSKAVNNVVTAAIVAAAVVTPVKNALASEASAAVDTALSEQASNGVVDTAYHWTFSTSVDSILTTGLKSGSYATPTANLSPLQAVLELSLEGDTRDAVLEIDLNGLRQAGYDIPEITRVTGQFSRPGGGYEIQFPYAVPPQFISRR